MKGYFIPDEEAPNYLGGISDATREKRKTGQEEELSRRYFFKNYTLERFHINFNFHADSLHRAKGIRIADSFTNQ